MPHRAWVNSAKNTLPDSWPINRGQLGGDAEPIGVVDCVGDVSRMHQSFGRNAASIQTRTAEAIRFDHRDTPVRELYGCQHVPASSSDDDEVVVVRDHRMRVP